MAVIVKKFKKIEREVQLPVGRYYPQIRSRHPSHRGLRRSLARLPFRSVIRLGSLTELDDLPRVELNSAEAIRNSSSKLRMKQCFTRNGVKTAEWWKYNSQSNSFILHGEGDQSRLIANLEYPIVAKSHNGSRGRGNTLLKTADDVHNFINARPNNLNGYIFEKYCNFNKEYRLHVTADGCFYTCRKMLRQKFRDHPNSWQRHDDNCVWILEENENFDKPNNWNEIVEHCVKAVVSCGLDFGACDLRVQNNTNADGERRDNPDFIVVEVNSAPSFGDMTLVKYKEELPKLLVKKAIEKGIYRE